MPRRNITVLDIPSNLGLRPPKPGAEPGVRDLAEALRRRDLIRRLGAQDAGSIDVPRYSPEPDPETLFRNGPGIISVSERIADRVRKLVSERRFVLALGGDCSILIGTMLGLRALGRYGLVFIDAHDDFSPLRNLDEYQGWFAAAGMDLGVVTGRTPGGLCDLRGLKPYVQEEDVSLFGISREPDDAEFVATEVLEQSEMRVVSLREVRELGPEAAARRALERFARKPLDGIWIHLDVDVLDRTVMPAVDSPNPDGLRFDELGAALEVLVGDRRVVGLEVTIYDPELDPDGSCGDQIADLLVNALGRKSHRPSPAVTIPDHENG